MEITTIGQAFKLKSGTQLSAKNMQKGIYPVFGGNGINGYHNEYIFEEPMIVIGRVGAYCGNVHRTKHKSWITDNALYIDKHLLEYDDDYLIYLLRNLKLNQYASQSGQPLISFGRIKDVKIPFPPLPDQKRIAAILDEADKLRQLDKQLLEKYYKLAQSLFLDMFGDPVVNPKGWEKKKLNDLGKIQTGNTPPRAKKENYGTFIEWIKTNNINTPFDYLTTAEEFLSKEGLTKGRLAHSGSILVTCIAGSKSVIGNAAIANRDVTFNQQINAISPNNDNVKFLYHQFKNAKGYIQTFSTNSMKGMINKTAFGSINFIVPPIELQNQFAERIAAIEAQKAQVQTTLANSNNLFDSLLQKAFKGAL